MKVPGLRSDDQRVGGLVFFGRMLDKIRLMAAGKLPAGYNTGTDDWSHFDSRCTRFLGVDYAALQERVLQGGTDEETLEWCCQRGRRPSLEEIEIWNDFLTKRGWRDGGTEQLEADKRRRGFAHRDDIQTWFDFHRADEAEDA